MRRRNRDGVHIVCVIHLIYDASLQINSRVDSRRHTESCHAHSFSIVADRHGRLGSRWPYFHSVRIVGTVIFFFSMQSHTVQAHTEFISLFPSKITFDERMSVTGCMARRARGNRPVVMIGIQMKANKFSAYVRCTYLHTLKLKVWRAKEIFLRCIKSDRRVWPLMVAARLMDAINIDKFDKAFTDARTHIAHTLFQVQQFCTNISMSSSSRQNAYRHRNRHDRRRNVFAQRFYSPSLHGCSSIPETCTRRCIRRSCRSLELPLFAL